MAQLEHMHTGALLQPTSRCIVGRAPTAGLVVDDPLVSGEHAAIVWTSDGWTLRDLGSRNGTWLGDERVLPGAVARLSAGDVLQFGTGDSCWVIVDDAAPDGIVGSTMLPRTVEAARAVVPVEHLALHLAVGSGEEYVEVQIVGPNATWTLAPRAYHDLYLVLGRERLRDKAAGVSEREQGWVYFDDLCRMLARNRRQVNVEVHRARQQLGTLAIDAPATVFERRAPTRQIRLGIRRVQVQDL